MRRMLLLSFLAAILTCTIIEALSELSRPNLTGYRRIISLPQQNNTDTIVSAEKLGVM